MEVVAVKSVECDVGENVHIIVNVQHMVRDGCGDCRFNDDSCGLKNDNRGQALCYCSWR